MRRLSERLFQRANPGGQDELRIAADKKMNVIGHDDVPAYGDVEVPGSAFGKTDECDVNWIGGEPLLATVGAKRYEPDGGVYRLVDARQPRRATGESVQWGGV